MDKLIQMGKDLGYEGQASQQFVKQQQDIERSERLAERELEKERIAAEKGKIAQVEKDREVELAKIAQVEKDREVELARIAAEKEKIAADREIEMSRIESMERQAEKDREAKLAQIEGDKEAKLATEIELEKLKYSFERRHDDLKGQMNLQRAVFKVELEKQKAEKAAHARDPKLPYSDESKDKMDSYLSRFEKYATANEWKKSVWAAYLSALLKGLALDVYDRLSADDAADYEKLKEALIDESTQRYSLAMVEIDVHFSKEKLRHYVWMIHYMTLLLEILMGQNFRICPIFQLRQLLGLKLIRKRLTENLMSLNRSLARIKRHLSRLKIVTPN